MHLKAQDKRCRGGAVVEHGSCTAARPSSGPRLLWLLNQFGLNRQCPFEDIFFRSGTLIPSAASGILRVTTCTEACSPPCSPPSCRRLDLFAHHAGRKAHRHRLTTTPQAAFCSGVHASNRCGIFNLIDQHLNGGFVLSVSGLPAWRTAHQDAAAPQR